MNEIKQIIVDELKKLSLQAEVADLEFPKSLANGDFSFFVKDKSIDIDALPIEKIAHPDIEKVTRFGRFINFYLSKKYFANTVAHIIDPVAGGSSFGQNKNLAGQNIIIEYTDPNPFKQFHIGHLMSNSIGESLARIMESNGATVTRANYQGDVGPHVAKAIWGVMNMVDKKPAATAPLHEQTRFLGEAYVFGSNTYEDDASAKKEIDAINKKVYEKSDEEINRLYEWGRKISLEHFEELYRKLGTKFDLYFFESQSAPIGLFAVEELLAKGILERSEGAVVFKGEQYGLHTRVFVNSQGLPTYETKELGLSKLKFEKQDFDRSIVITANEQNDYFSVVMKVLEFYDHRAANRTKHVSHGMLRFAEGKMSSRKGNVITGESLIADVEALVREKMQDRDLSDSEKLAITEEVAIGAIKYSVLKQSPGRDIIFDFNKSLSFEGDSGPYIQYTHARASSILRKAADAGIRPDTASPEQATDLERLLVRFPALVERAYTELAPQLFVTYLTNLAAAFNHYYAVNVVIDPAASEASAYRVALTGAVVRVLANGLHLLGIRAPERM